MSRACQRGHQHRKFPGRHRVGTMSGNRISGHEKAPEIRDFLMGFGSPSRTRTYDLGINSPALYQLSYRGTEPGAAYSLVRQPCKPILRPGGPERNRTAVEGFADPCLTTRPPDQRAKRFSVVVSLGLARRVPNRAFGSEGATTLSRGALLTGGARAAQPGAGCFARGPRRASPPDAGCGCALASWAGADGQVARRFPHIAGMRERLRSAAHRLAWRRLRGAANRS